MSLCVYATKAVEITTDHDKANSLTEAVESNFKSGMANVSEVVCTNMQTLQWLVMCSGNFCIYKHVHVHTSRPEQTDQPQWAIRHDC